MTNWMELQLEGLEKAKYEARLRDMFAGQAMLAILVSVNRSNHAGYNLEGLGMEAYQVADIMMQQREKK